MLPRVQIHTAVSADGRTKGFDVDMGQFYGVVPGWGADCMLTGADTIVLAPEYQPDDPSAPAAEVGPSEADLLAVVDSRGRVRNWRALKKFTQFWRDPLALVSHATPREYLDEVRRAGCDALVAGDERVDLRAGLVHDLSLMVYAILVGGADEHTFNRSAAPGGALGPAPSLDVSLVDAQRLDGDVARLLYEVDAGG